MLHFNQPNIERKSCVWTTKYKRVLEMCIVQHIERKSVFTFQPMNRLNSTTVTSAKAAATISIFPLRTKNRQLYCLAVMVLIVLEKYESRLRKSKTISIFEEISPPVTSKHIRTQNKSGTSYSIYGMIMSTPDWLIRSIKTSFTISFYTLSVYIKAA